MSKIVSNPPGMSLSQAFRYNNGYTADTLLIPGMGYWVKTDGAGWLVFSSSAMAQASARVHIVRTSELPPPPPDEGAAATQPAPKVPGEYALAQNYPNPFNPATTIRYQLPEECRVTLKVYNLLGEEIAVLVNGPQAAGFRSAVFDASGIPSGIYIYKITAGSFSQVKKLVVLK
jgi:hypothetical protein